MLEIHFDRRGEVALENMADLMAAFPRYAHRAINSALASEGFRLKNIVQETIRAGGPGGSWPELNPHTGILGLAKRRDLKNYKMGWRGPKGKKRRVKLYWSAAGGKRSTRRNPLLKLRGAVRYFVDKKTQTMNIGFIRASTRLLAIVHAQAEGFTTPVTPRMRKFMFAMGFPLKKSTRALRTPPRPLISRIFDLEKDNVHENLRRKFLLNVTRYMLEGKRSPK